MSKSIVLRVLSLIFTFAALGIGSGLFLSPDSMDLPTFLVMALAAVSFGIAAVAVWRRAGQSDKSAR